MFVVSECRRRLFSIENFIYFIPIVFEFSGVQNMKVVSNQCG